MEKFEQPQQPISPDEGEITPTNPNEQERLEQEEIIAAEKKITDALVESTPEAEHAPAWLKETSKKIADAWFDPKSFESQETYEKIGVRIFKKFMPSSGDYVYRYVWKKFGAPDWVKPGNIDSLKNMQFFTRVYETIHVSFLALGAGVMASQLSAGNINAAAFTAALNTLVNVYPIMVQRYNRLRLYRNINKMEERNAKGDNKAKSDESGDKEIEPES